MLRRWFAGATLLTVPFLHLNKPPRAEPVATPTPSTQPGSPAGAATTPTSQYANLLDDECPWCIAMKKGPCGKQFATWQRCVKDIRAEQESRAASSLSSFSMSEAERHKRDEAEYQRECMDYFRRYNTDDTTNYQLPPPCRVTYFV